MATVFTSSTGNAANFNTTDLDNVRRVFNFGERVAELAPQQSPFFVYLSKVAKKATNDPVFKFLEQRHQWQRRNFIIGTTAFSDSSGTAIGTAMGSNDDLYLACKYDKYGNVSTSEKACHFIVPGLVLALKLDDGSVVRWKIAETATTETTDSPTSGAYITYRASDDYTLVQGEALIPLDTISAGAGAALGNAGQVIGSAWAEGTDSPQGWEDKLYDREGFCQIFKTGMNLFSGTAMATEYRGIKNEYQRIWQDKLMEHKMDIEEAMLFGKGGKDVADVGSSDATSPSRTTWGIVNYTENYGKVYNMSYASSGYDAFLDAMEDFFAVEGGNSGEKLVLASRKVITYLNKLGAGSFMNNSVGYANPIRFSNEVALGTDGIGADMLEEFRLAYARHRESDVTASPETAWQWLQNGYQIVPEAMSDRVVWNYKNMDPWELAFTTGVNPVEVIVEEETIWSNGHSTRVDAAEIRAKAAEQAKKVHSRLAEVV